jgi:hypothetical protein
MWVDLRWKEAMKDTLAEKMRSASHSFVVKGIDC